MFVYSYFCYNKNMEKIKKYISIDAPAEVFNHIQQLGYDTISIRPTEQVNSPVSSHPDIQMCRMGCHDKDELILAQSNELGSVYPDDIPFNAACTGKYFIHNLKYTNPRLLARARELEMNFIDVKQGYTKCSMVIVDEDSIITYDDGISSACQAQGMNVLSIQPGFVKLNGYNTGFIGGTSGRVGNTIMFSGDISKHPDGEQIIDFIKNRGLNVEWLDFPLTDIGSII